MQAREVLSMRPWWWHKSRWFKVDLVRYWIAARLLDCTDAPRCDTCAIPITGHPYNCGEYAESVCTLCAGES